MKTYKLECLKIIQMQSFIENNEMTTLNSLMQDMQIKEKKKKKNESKQGFCKALRKGIGTMVHYNIEWALLMEEILESEYNKLMTQ